MALLEVLLLYGPSERRMNGHHVCHVCVRGDYVVVALPSGAAIFLAPLPNHATVHCMIT